MVWREMFHLESLTIMMASCWHCADAMLAVRMWVSAHNKLVTCGGADLAWV